MWEHLWFAGFCMWVLRIAQCWEEGHSFTSAHESILLVRGRGGGGLSDFSLMFLCFLSTPLTCWISKKCYYNTGQKTVWHTGWVQPFCPAVWPWGSRLERRCPCSCSRSSFGLAGKQAAGRGEYSPSAGSALGLCPGLWSSCSDPSVLSQEGGSTIQSTCQPGRTPVPAIQEILTA